MTRMKAASAVVAITVALGGCGNSSTTDPVATVPMNPAPDATIPANITINSPGLLPEGIEYDTKHNRFLVGSMSQGTIFIVGNDGSLTPFIQDPDLKSSVGLEVDEERNRLLVANADMAVMGGQSAGIAKLGIYDLDSGQRIAMVDLGAVGPEGAKKHFANDVAIGKDGSAYVTDSEARVVFKVDPANNPSVFVANNWANLERFIFNGIAYHPSGTLLVVESSQGKIFAVNESDPSTITEVALPEPVNGDGMVWAANGDLLVVRNSGGSPQVAALRSQDNWKTATLAGTAGLGVPASTAAVVGDSVYVVHFQFGNPAAAPFIEKVVLQ